MNVQFTRVHPPGWRWRDNSRRAEWGDAFAAALVDGHLVKVNPNRGWTCDCPDAECGHPDAVAALIAPRLLAQLEGRADNTDRKQ